MIGGLLRYYWQSGAALPATPVEGGRKTFFDASTPSKPLESKSVDMRIAAHQAMFDAQARQRRECDELLVISAAIAFITALSAR